jgi:hypothetical protein
MCSVFRPFWQVGFDRVKLLSLLIRSSFPLPTLQVACWVGHAGVPAKVKWAPRRMLVASASEVLALWIPDLNKLSGLAT